MSDVTRTVPRARQLGAWAAMAVVGMVYGQAGAEVPRGVRAGAAAVDITPAPGVSLDGPISQNGPVRGVHDRLFARALVLDDGATRIGMVICDACIVGKDVFDAAKERIEKRIGLVPAHVLMAATHTHAAPRTIHIGTQPQDDEYHEYLATRIAEAVVRAAGNLAPARVGWGSFGAPQYVSCRRFLCEPGTVSANPFGEKGERIKSVAGSSTAVIEPAGPVDPEVVLLSVQHADGQPLAVLANYSVHYCGGYQRGQISADYFGYFARALAERLEAGGGRPPFVGMMSNGTSGNIGAVATGGKRYAAFQWMQESGRILAAEAAEVVRQMEHRSDASLAMRESELEFEVRRPSGERLAWARQMLDTPSSAHPHRWTRVYAREALHLSRYPRTTRIKVQAVRIGDLGIVAVPCEVFAETGLDIKRKSPLDLTCTISLANGYGGYLPPPEQHRLGGYETWPARSSFLEVEAEPRIVAESLRLLTEVARAVPPN